jgi:hypothetical protein
MAGNPVVISVDLVSPIGQRINSGKNLPRFDVFYTGEQ